MLATKEYYELIEMFEKNAGKPFRKDKEPKDMWNRGIVYQDGMANEFFKMFLEGYAYGKAIGRME